MEQFDLFPEWDKKAEKEEKIIWEKIDTILENACPNCWKTWYNGHCPSCWYREEDSELFSSPLNTHIKSYFCHTCKTESFSGICPHCKKNVKHWETISNAKIWIGKKIDKWVFVGVKVTYFNFPNRIWEQKASFDFILEEQNKTRHNKKKKIRIYIDYTWEKRKYNDQEWWKEIEIFQTKIIRREGYNEKNKKWEKVNFFNDDEFRAISFVIQSLLKEKNKI